MKRLYTSTLLLIGLSAQIAIAQQIPLSSLYNENRFSINPANAGDGEFLEAYIGTRNQWNGIAGNPQTHYLSVHSPLGKRGSNLGMNLYYDRTTIINTLNVSLAYAHDITLAKDHNLSVGLAVGLHNTSLHMTDAVVQDPSDVVLTQGDINGFTVNGSAGLRYNWKDLEFGASADNLFGTGPQFERVGSNFKMDLERQYNFYLGYEIWLKDRTWLIHPSGMYRFIPGAPIQYDANLRFGYKDIVWLGGSYRAETGPVASVGFTVADRFSFAYAYDFSLNSVDSDPWSHEIMIGVKLGGFIKRIDNLENDMDGLKTDNLLLNTRMDSVENLVDSTANKLDQEIERIDGTDRNQQEQLDSIDVELDKLYRELEELENGMGLDSNQLRNLLKRLTPYYDADGNLSASSTDLESGYYVVIESFRSLENAYRGVDIWKKKGRDAIIVHDTERKWYYVYSQKYGNKRDARREMMRTRKKDVKDAWVHKYRVFD